MRGKYALNQRPRLKIKLYVSSFKLLGSSSPRWFFFLGDYTFYTFYTLDPRSYLSLDFSRFPFRLEMWGKFTALAVWHPSWVNERWCMIAQLCLNVKWSHAVVFFDYFFVMRLIGWGNSFSIALSTDINQVAKLRELRSDKDPIQSHVAFTYRRRHVSSKKM